MLMYSVSVTLTLLNTLKNVELKQELNNED
ncbi:hypothetical protein KORDIASMS9_00797 [Kordia sp. SMS9]|nr:hypothetical protein KORDIASMS9_00797 [Kordia sp. SMS9]